MKKIILLIYFIVSLQTTFSQSNNIDTTLQTIIAEKDDYKRIDMMIHFFGMTSEIDPVLDMQNAQKLLSLAKKNKDKITEAFALSEIGYDYRAFGNTAKSLEYNLKADLLAKKTGNEKLISHTGLSLAHIYKDQADYSKAVGTYLSVVQTGSALKDNILQIWAFTSLGQVYIRMNKLDSALVCCQRAHELSMQIHYTDFLSNNLRYLGSIHGKMGNHALAVGYFDMAIKEAYRSNSTRWKNECYTALAEYYHDIHQNDSSLTYAKKAIAVVKNTPFSNKTVIPAKLLLDIYENNNSDSALKYFKVYRAANDSLFGTKVIQQTQVLKFENEVRQQEIATEKVKAEQQRKQNIQYALLALGIITFIILFLMLSRRHITNTKLIQFLGVVALLLVFEFLNLLLHPFLERITHHSPVLMLLALVCIAALLVPLHHKLEKWATHKLVEKNKAVRLASARKTIEELEKN